LKRKEWAIDEKFGDKESISRERNPGVNEGEAIRLIKISLKEVDRCKKLDKIVRMVLLNGTTKRWRRDMLKRICSLFVIKY
jgi:hypothetical protein